MSILLQAIRDALAEGVPAIRITASLTTADGGAKILPPTYADAPHAHNMVEPGPDGMSSWVSVDAPASFANRVEQALVRSNLGLDPLRVTVGERALSSMQLPHRCFDAVLRDSTLDGMPFRKTEIGKRLIGATPDHAGSLYQFDPGVLLFGAWDSTELGKAGGSGNKWPACFSAEISATNVIPVKRAGNRVDPLGIEGTDATLVEEEDGTLRTVQTEDDEKLPVLSDKNRNTYPRRIKPSQANHGNSLSLIDKGVLVRGQIKMHGALSLSRLRRYQFGTADDTASRVVLALMAIYGATAVLEDGLDLRRDCVLVPETVSWEFVKLGGTIPIECSAGSAREALIQALSAAPVASPVTLVATESLRHLVERYR